jgi:type IV pilus assembly protein PilC
LNNYGEKSNKNNHHLFEGEYIVGEYSQKSSKVRKLSLDELALFSYQLSLVLKSGVPYLDGMELIKNEIDDNRMKQVATELYEDLRSGKKLYESFEHQGVFPVYFVQMTQIAEKAGMLDVEMERLSEFYDKTGKTQYKVRSALVYPIILFVLMISVLMLLVLKVFPIFQEVLASLGGDLPASTAFIFEISGLLQRSVVWVLAVIAVAILGLVFYSRTKPGGLLSDSLKLKSTFVRKVYQRLVALRFAQGLSMMVRSGIPFEDAILLSAPLTGNQYSQKRIEEAQAAVSQGVSVVEALKATSIFPDLFIQMLSVGFKSGQVDTMLPKLAEIYEVELDRATRKMTSAIEPTLVIVLSVVVAAILLTVMLPMIQIMSSIG